MRLVNHLNEVLEIRVNKYTTENSVNQYFESDELDVTFSIKKEGNYFERELKFMTLEQFELMEKWLTIASTTAGPIKILYFVDVDLEFRKFTRGNIPYMRIILRDLYQEWIKKPVSWDFIISKKNVHLMRMELQETIEDFPCRCGMVHDCHKL